VLHLVLLRTITNFSGVRHMVQLSVSKNFKCVRFRRAQKASLYVPPKPSI